MAASVAVIIVNWNAGEHLRACLRALADQTEGGFRAVVVDNASTDGSPAAVAELGDPRFELLALDRNTGFAFANNAGARHTAPTEFIALLNPDAVPQPDWLAGLLRA